MRRHWSEIMGCSCGATFRSPIAEARHRHNFPLLCRKPKKEKGDAEKPVPRHTAAEEAVPGGIRR